MIPRGWSYDPSAWSERVPIIVLASVGAAIAGYLSLFQLGIVPSVWEPFFGRGSETILRSSVSRVLPIPDALLGMFGYLADAVTGAIGGRGRWRTLPWVVILFGIAVGPLGVVSVLLVVLQPVLFDTWCTLCLGSAVISLAMIGPAMDEVLASVQHLRRTSHAAAPHETGARWAQLVALALGLALVVAPAALGWDGLAADAAHTAGAVAASVAFVALWEITRPLRWLLPVVGAAFVVALAIGWPGPTGVLGIVAAVLLAACALPRAATRADYGGGWAAALRRDAAASARER